MWTFFGTEQYETYYLKERTVPTFSIRKWERCVSFQGLHVSNLIRFPDRSIRAIRYSVNMTYLEHLISIFCTLTIDKNAYIIYSHRFNSFFGTCFKHCYKNVLRSIWNRSVFFFLIAIFVSRSSHQLDSLIFFIHWNIFDHPCLEICENISFVILENNISFLILQVAHIHIKKKHIFIFWK